MIDPTRPAPTRDALASLPISELILRFATGVENLNARVTKLSDADLDTAFRPEANVGRWPCRVLLGHLADAELPFVMRMRRIVAEDHPMLEPWDENAFIDNNMYGSPQTGARYPIGAFIATVHTLRAWTSGWLQTLPPQAFERKGLHAERGEQTLRTILEYDTWHLEHHAWFLNAKVARLTGS